MTYTIRRRILKIPAARTGRSWLKKIKFKGYNNLSLYRFLKIFIGNLQEDEIMARANGVAFNFILAIFPTIIFLFTLIPYVSNYFPTINENSIMAFLGDLMPDNMYSIASSAILDIVRNQRGGLLTFGFVLALYLATNGMMTLMRAFNACYRTVEKRNWLTMWLTATGLTIMLSFVLLFASAMLIVGQIALHEITHVAKISNFGLDHYLLDVLRFFIILVVFFLAISSIYYFGPAVHYNWRFFSIGSVISTLAFLGISYGFSFYVANFSSYNKVYGSIGALIALMVWVQLVTAVLLFGYEINASLHYGRKIEAIDAHRKTKRIEKAMR
jgi:membrane protein